MGNTLIKYDVDIFEEVFQRILVSLGISRTLNEIKMAFINSEKEAKDIDLFSSFGKTKCEEYWYKWDSLVLKHLGENGHITCVDRSSYWLKKARKRLKKFSNVAFALGNINKLEIPEKAFDVVIARYVIHDIAPEERQRIMNTLANKLKSGGALYIWEPTKISHGMPAEEIKELLSKSGLQESSHEKTKSSFKGKYLKID